MNFIASVGKFLGSMLGLSQSHEKIIDKVTNGLDKLSFDAQERAESRARLIEVLGNYMQQTEGQNPARRVVAFSIIGVWLMLIITLFVSAIAGAVETAESAVMLLDEYVHDLARLVVIFYFGIHAVKQLGSGVIDILKKVAKKWM